MVLLASIGVPEKQRKMRAQQLWHWMYVRGAKSFDEMTNVSKALRADLARHYTVDRPEVVEKQVLRMLADPRATPELLLLRERIRSWRFYDHFRTDAQAPARQPQLGTHTPVLGHDGTDLAAALQTIREIGDAPRAIAEAAIGAEAGASDEHVVAEERALPRDA